MHLRDHAIVITLNSNLSTLAGDTRHGTDSDQSVVDLWHLLFKQTAEETVVGARQDYLGIVVLIVNTLHDRPYHIALMEGVAGYLLILRHDQFVLVLVYKKSLAFPHLVNLPGDYLTLKAP